MMLRALVTKNLIAFKVYLSLVILAELRVQNAQDCVYISLGTILQCENHIPLTISSSERSVILLLTKPVILTNMTFQGGGWENLSSLQIKYENSTEPILLKKECFIKFKNLWRLGLQLVYSILDSNVFVGLDNLKTLDLSYSVQFSQRNLLRTFNPQQLMQLRELNLTKTGNKNNNGLDLNETFWKFVGERQINIIDISAMCISNFNFSSFYLNCKHLKNVYAVSTHVKTAHAFLRGTPMLNNRFSLMIKDTVIERLVLWCMGHTAFYKQDMDVEVNKLIFLPTVQLTHIENRCPVRFRTLIIEELNLTGGIQLSSRFDLNILSLNIRNNFVIAINNAILHANSTLLMLSMSQNSLSFICPSAFFGIRVLKSLDLSNNNLEKMNKRQSTLFETLFDNLTQLVNLNLSKNGLTNIPKNIFRGNCDLHVVDLSWNRITQVTFKMKHLISLKYLKLNRNHIITLESSLRNEFDVLFQTHWKAGQTSINIAENGLTCADCLEYECIRWLKSNKKYFAHNDTLDCINVNRTLVNVFDLTLDGQCPVEYHSKLNVWTVLFIIIMILNIFISSAAIKVYLKRRNKIKLKKDVTVSFINPNRIEHVVFLAYSSEDEEFIEECVVMPLQRTLKKRLGNDVNPLFIGDREFRVGKYIHDEIISCLNRCKVVIVLLTDHFCRSGYCMLEFQKACQLNRPVIFMIKDKINEEMMTPMMKIHFHTNTRIIWTIKNGRYILKGTWPSVCETIMELATK